VRRTLIVLLAVCAFAAAGEDPVAWGPPTAGMRLGIGLGPITPEPQLRLVFQSVGTSPIDVLLGGMREKGPVYNLVFRIKSPAGVESDLFNFNGPPGIAGHIEPIIAHIARGRTYEILLSLKKFRAIENGRERTLPDLLAAHYSVRATLDTSGDPRQIRPLGMWMGAVTSGDFHR